MRLLTPGDIGKRILYPSYRCLACRGTMQVTCTDMHLVPLVRDGDGDDNSADARSVASAAVSGTESVDETAAGTDDKQSGRRHAEYAAAASAADGRAPAQKLVFDCGWCGNECRANDKFIAVYRRYLECKRKPAAKPGGN